MVVENSLATAVSKLRKALDDAGGDIVETVPRIGYRLAAAVSVEMVQAPREPRFEFQAGDTAPGRGQWRLLQTLGRGEDRDVWRARHVKTGQTRVLKYALTPDRLWAVRREATIARLFMRSYGPDAPFVRLLALGIRKKRCIAMGRPTVSVAPSG